jgi:hypothetical protein
MYTPRSVSNVLDDFSGDGRSRTPQMNNRERDRRRSDEEVSPTQQIVDDWRSANPDVSSSSVNSHAPDGVKMMMMMGGNNRAQSPNHVGIPFPSTE